MDKEVTQLMEERRAEIDRLRRINSVSFDFTFLYDSQANVAIITRYVDNHTSEPDKIANFKDFLLSKTHPDDISLLEKELRRTQQAVQEIGFEIRLKETSGRRYRWHSVKMCLDDTGDSICYVGSSTYIDTRKNKESELVIKARQDPLTGLLNKMVTQENINEFTRKNPNTSCALIVFDIDNFKHFNDTMGHLFGDEVIKETANALRRIFSKDSFVGRIGGDEFCVFVKDISDVAALVTRMGKIQDAFSKITLGQKTNFRVTCSIGISLFPDMGADFDELFSCADMALYSIKNNGRNSYAFYTDELYDEELIKEGEKRLENAEFESRQPYSLTNFAYHLLNESENISSAINLLLYKIQNDYDLEAIHVHELDPKNMRTEVTYEIAKEGRPLYINRSIEFSHKTLKKVEEEENRNGGFILYDYSQEKKPYTGNGVETWRGIGSVLHVAMRLFSKNRGTVELISAHGVHSWTPKKIEELISVCNLLTVCIYYSSKVHRAELEVSKYNEYDSLTGLMKEETFTEAATKIIAAKGDSSKLAVVYCDISNFKYINETYGYEVGDRLLSNVAAYISNRIPGVILSGRFYSDNILGIMEFKEGTSDEKIMKTLDDITQEMSSYLSQTFNISNIQIKTGVYTIPDSNTDADLSISNANMARKIAKSSQGASCVIFDQEMFEKRRRQIEYIQALDEAIANEEFYVVMQPKVSGSRNQLMGAEALVRWKRPDGNEIYPDEFIPAFEKDGSVVKLDFYVYEKVMAYIRERLDSGKKVLPISMNVSRAHLTAGNFVPKFKALVDKYQIPTQFIELEITEGIYLENLDIFNSMFEELRMLGIRISMDDFGSGYSSLNALNDLKIDLLKIDRIFMKDENLRESDKTIIRFIIDMAKNLSMKVICEGVETKAQRTFLNEAGCDLHQGYLYSKPVTIPVFNDFIDNEDLLFARVG